MLDVKARWILAAVASVLVQGCARQYENHVLVAQCDAGNLYVDERVEIKPALRGGSSSVDFSLYYVDQRDRRVEIPVSHLGSYRAPSADRLRIYRNPQDGDWQLYVAPASLDVEDYEAFATCIRTKWDEIYRKMSVARVPHQFESVKRTLPYIATIRYADLTDLKKQYRCEPEGVVQVQENGLIYVKRHSSVLIGSVFEEGSRIALDELALHYLRLQEEDKIADPIAYLRQCRSGSGLSMFQDFDVSTLPNERPARSR